MIVSELHDPASAAYKKARKRHSKTTRNRPSAVEADWTPFRAAEKRYKARFPPPDLCDVLDLALDDPARAVEVGKGWWRGRVDAVDMRRVTLKGGGRGYVFNEIPGLVILPGFVDEAEQRELVRWALRDHARPPNVTNLDTHYDLPTQGLWTTAISSPSTIVNPLASTSASASTSTSSSSPPGPRTLISNAPASPSSFTSLAHDTPKPVPAPSTTVPPLPASQLLNKLRWANIGWFYHWGTKQYDFARGRVPLGPRVQHTCVKAVAAVPWGEVFAQDDGEGWGDEGPDWSTWDESYEPDAGIVNFYQTKDTLMAHVDRSEICATSPLVSISLGNAAVFLIGGTTRDIVPSALLLRSGDVVIMSGPACRRAYHGVPRTLEGTLPPHFHRGDDAEWTPYADYLANARINVNVRQVFPKGFEPGLGD